MGILKEQAYKINDRAAPFAARPHLKYTKPRLRRPLASRPGTMKRRYA